MINVVKKQSGNFMFILKTDELFPVFSALRKRVTRMPTFFTFDKKFTIPGIVKAVVYNSHDEWT